MHGDDTRSHKRRYHARRCPLCMSAQLTEDRSGNLRCEACGARFSFHEALLSLADEGYEPPHEPDLHKPSKIETDEFDL